MSFYRIQNRNVAGDNLHKVFIDNDAKLLTEGNLEFAKRHAIANKIAYEDTSVPPFFCTCCMKNINRIDFDLDCETDELG